MRYALRCRISQSSRHFTAGLRILRFLQRRRSIQLSNYMLNDAARPTRAGGTMSTQSVYAGLPVRMGRFSFVAISVR